MRRPAPVAVLCGLLLWCASLATDSNGYLGTDTGGKVATVAAMVEGGTWRPDVGYWAEGADPDGLFHPMWGTVPTDAGWVQVTSLPMILAARPLWALGGYRATLLLPIAGTVLASLAALSLVRQLRRRGWPEAEPLSPRGEAAVVATICLASPLTVYALDLWEHSLGVAAMLWATSLLLAGSERVPAIERAARAAGAGSLFAVAASMRTESLAYAGVAAATVCIGAALGAARPLWSRERRERGRVEEAGAGVAAHLYRALVASGVLGASFVVGFLPVWLANASLESALGGASRADRAAGAASGVGLELSARLVEGLQTSLGAHAVAGPEPVVIGGIIAAAVALAAAFAAWIPAGRGTWIVTAGAAMVVVVVAPGLGFVPGFAVALPLAAAGAGVAIGRRGFARTPAVIAVAALPVVWMFQYVGGAGPQWGGRYVLTTGFLLAAVALAVPARGAAARAVMVSIGLVGASITAMGVAWLIERSHEIVDVFDWVEAEQDGVLIAANPFFPREAGVRVLDQRWLSLPEGHAVSEAAAVARRTGAHGFSVLRTAGGDEPVVDGAELTDRDVHDAFGGRFELLHYRFQD